MGDRKPKKNSSGNSDAHKAKQAKPIFVQQPLPKADEKAKKKK